MARLHTGDSKGLERVLFRQAMDLILESRPRCSDCRRRPLEGERVHVYTRGRVVCALCRPRHDEPLRTETVPGFEHGHTVVPIRVRRLA
jgi:hypothetical protein